MNDSADFKEVIASYHRGRASGQLFDTFYDILLAKSPQIRSKFAQTDFPRQKRLLKSSLLAMLSLQQGISSAEEEIDRIAVRHGRQDLDIHPGLYDLWLDALCEALAEHDPLFQPELESKWRRLMRVGIERMIEHY